MKLEVVTPLLTVLGNPCHSSLLGDKEVREHVGQVLQNCLCGTCSGQWHGSKGDGSRNLKVLGHQDWLFLAALWNVETTK